ncbi:hypothetical protein [Gordonia humi]|uniref:Mce-associated membrane protein n=1 Tax=Gordonia humi TaxID=686429 RepID=A0A840EXE0_9ACTN|nr:hypothetical protein [Gordonia humi]MBB4134953.1 hypothetical protein [Gordonia humi]
MTDAETVDTGMIDRTTTDRATTARGGCRRAAAVRLAVVAMAAVAVITACIGAWGLASGGDDADGAVADVSAALTVMLTPDPADARGYVEQVLDASAGAQRRRIESGRAALTEYVAALSVRPAGRIVSAGLEDADGDSATVLAVAQATDPTLIGGTSDDDRVTVRITAVREADRWLITDTEASA